MGGRLELIVSGSPLQKSWGAGGSESLQTLTRMVFFHASWAPLFTKPEEVTVQRVAVTGVNWTR